jgi:uncharacterized protein YybS (DUF2232 family)
MPMNSSSPSPRRQPPVALVETAFLSSTAALLYLINYYFPIGPFLKLLFPIPVALVYLRWGNRAGWMGALVSTMLLSVLMGPTRSISYAIPYALMGVCLGAFWRKGMGWGRSMVVGALLDCLGVFFRIWLTSVLVGEDLWIYVIARISDMAEWIFIQLGILAQPSILIIQLMAISMVLISNFAYVFTVHLIALLLFDRLGNPIPRPPHWVDVLLEN